MYPHAAPPVASSTPPTAAAPATHAGETDRGSGSVLAAPYGTYHDARTVPQARTRRARRRSSPSLLGLGLLVVACVGCSESGAHLPLVSTAVEQAGTKMLRPGAHAAACRSRVLGVTVTGDPSPLDRAVQTLLALDPEADSLINVRIEVRTLSLGVVDRVCATVHADVARAVSVVRLPSPGGHEGHH